MLELTLCLAGLNLGFVLGAWFQSRAGAARGAKHVLAGLRREFQSLQRDDERLRRLDQLLRLELVSGDDREEEVLAALQDSNYATDAEI